MDASENRASNDEQPRPACSGDLACLLEPSKELHSNAGKMHNPLMGMEDKKVSGWKHMGDNRCDVQ